MQAVSRIALHHADHGEKEASIGNLNPAVGPKRKIPVARGGFLRCEDRFASCQKSRAEKAGDNQQIGQAKKE